MHFDPSCPKRLVIPPEIDGIPVTALSSAAFRGADLLSVDLPPSVTDVGPGAFDHNPRLEWIKARRGTYIVDEEVLMDKILWYD